jgi:hypothetical protein
MNEITSVGVASVGKVSGGYCLISCVTELSQVGQTAHGRLTKPL